MLFNSYIFIFGFVPVVFFGFYRIGIYRHKLAALWLAAASLFFYGITQITFLVDTYQGKVKEYDFVHYILFVTYFPHLIAGPVLHHKEMMGQFANANTYKFSYIGVATGVTVFIMGLFKKVIFA